MIQEQRIKNKRLEEYNDVIKNNFHNIKELFNSEEFKATIQRESNKSFSLILIEETDTKKVEHKFNCFSELEKLIKIIENLNKINGEKIYIKAFVEDKLKDFVLRIAKIENIQIKETPVRGLRAKSGNIIDESYDMSK